MQRFLCAAAVLYSACAAEPVASTQQDVRLGVIEAHDQFGWAMATGDYNCDGVDDLAVSAIGEGPNGGKTTGSVFMYLGVAGLGLVPWTRIDEKDLLPLSLGNNDRFGSALASAKIDADACSDLVIGAPGAAITSGGNHSGVVFVLYGSTTGLRIDNSVQVIDQHGLVSGETDSPGDNFGATLALSGENPPLLAIGVPGETVGSIKSGFVNVAKADLSQPKGQQFAKFAQLQPPTLDAGAQFGTALVFSDFDFDGHRDLAVGEPDWGYSPGKVFVYPGNGSGYDAAVTVNEHSSLQTSNYDGFGSTLAVGAILSNGGELIVGAPDFYTGNGRVFLYAPNGGHLSGFTVMDGIAVGNGGIGSSLKVADIDGDGNQDIVTGVPGHRSAQTGVDLGEIAIYEFHFDPEDLTLTQQLSWTAQVGPSGYEVTPADGDDFGVPVAVGDFNADGKKDLVGGMPNRSDEGNGTDYIANSGAFVEFFGNGAPTLSPPFTAANGIYFDESSQ